MKASRIVLVFASFLMAGLFSQAAYAACPCAVDACTDPGPPPESNPPHGPNGCTDDPTGLVLPATDGKGCIEVTPDEEEDCTACVGGAVRSQDVNGTPEDPTDDTLVLVRGCACTAHPLGGWNCVSTAGVQVDLDADPPDNIILGDPPVVPELVILNDGTSECEMQAAAACMLP
ncbi:MAG: hypothetical protein ACREA0_25935 [bacterium]